MLPCLSIRCINELEHVHVSDQQCVRCSGFQSYKRIYMVKTVIIYIYIDQSAKLFRCFIYTLCWSDAILCSRLLKDGIKVIAWPFNFSLHNNQDMGYAVKAVDS